MPPTWKEKMASIIHYHSGRNPTALINFAAALALHYGKISKRQNDGSVYNAMKKILNRDRKQQLLAFHLQTLPLIGSLVVKLLDLLLPITIT